MLTNAIYFKGDWVSPFNKRGTQDQDFSVSAQRKVNTPLMQQKASFGYGEEETLQALEMPYAGRDLSMVGLLPKKIDGLPELESLTLEGRPLLAKLRNREVIAYIPKFKLETAFGLKTTLEALGMKQAFSRQADFSGISTEENLYLCRDPQSVRRRQRGRDGGCRRHRRGDEGHASSAARAHPGLPCGSSFLFLIRDTRSGSILFLGRVIDPTK